MRSWSFLMIKENILGSLNACTLLAGENSLKNTPPKFILKCLQKGLQLMLCASVTSASLLVRSAKGN